MTSETRTMVELADIVAIEFECSKCHAAVTYSLNEKPTRVIEKCPNCFEPFYSPLPPVPQRDPSISEQVVGWINALCSLKNHKDVTAKLRFHVNIAK